ncbi:Short chain dehydrogenase asqE [Pseudocercospora fuligena]|uniref:Short chain dehydrogenase asqE n=1 Tax=Pseudocercospora fuligena TaxID=685502 RepID=A0A8H6RUM3_9PEZI|nr:Short chain dehydrogenase asqE [Pseudocercospora fuligena]
METLPAPLKGKIALVTGASRGIGAAIAEKIVYHGCTHIALTYVSNPKLAAEVEQRIHSINPNIKTVAFAMDVCDPNCGELAVEQTLKGLGVDRIDILVSNAAMAGTSSFQTIEEMTKEWWDSMMTANIWAPFTLARECAKFMPRGGRIIVLSSANSKLAMGDPFLAYCVAKAGGDALVRNLAATFGVQKGITVNSISVGPVETDALRESFAAKGPEFEAMAHKWPLLQRIGQPEEVANIVAFVASPGASYIHGNQIPANGGGLAMLQG